MNYRVMLTAAAFAVVCLFQPGPGSPSQSLSAQTKGGPGVNRIDINRASIDELKTLPGIRDAWAQAIAKHRPYKNKTQLLSRKILPYAAYKAIEDQIIARH